MFDELISAFIYLTAALFCLAVLYIYIKKQSNQSKITEGKILLAKEEGMHEPLSLHPVIDMNSCIGSGACVKACPEKDILGMVKGKAAVINPTRCIGHGACFNACPVRAITLNLGSEKRGVDLPIVDKFFETNVPGIYIAGEIGGMGLIKNAVEQGRQAVENLSKRLTKKQGMQYDLLIVGAGPAGISASLTAKKNNLNAVTLDQDSLGGTVFSFPRSKIVMTSPMDLTLHGKLRLTETSKTDLLNLWKDLIQKHQINIKELTKVESITPGKEGFNIITSSGEVITAEKVLLAIGRRGTPRKIGVPGEELEKVAYRLMEPELIVDKDILIVGGGDAAVESALLLSEKNRVCLSYRGEAFSRLKSLNKTKIEEAVKIKTINLLLNSNVISISNESVTLSLKESDKTLTLNNDLVYVFAGGELPTEFLAKAGINITTMHGEAILKHNH